MQAPFRFICFTDRVENLLPGIEPYPIPDLGLSPEEWYIGGVWPKLGIFDGRIFGLRGRALFIDLDMVILRDLDAFFDSNKPYVGIDAGPRWCRPRSTAPPQLGSALIAFDFGDLSYIADKFRANKAEILKAFRTEQAFTESVLSDIDFWPDGWVISFKRSLRQPFLLDLIVQPRRPPVTAKIIAFHGSPRPIDLINSTHRFWDRFPHLGNGPVSWMVDYWSSNLPR